MKKLLLITIFAFSSFFACNTTEKQIISEKLNRLSLLKNALEEKIKEESLQLQSDHPTADLLLSELPNTFYDHSDFLKIKKLKSQINEACEHIIPADKIELIIFSLGFRYLHYSFSLKNTSQPTFHSDRYVNMIIPRDLVDTEEKHDLVYIENKLIPYYQKYHNSNYPSDPFKGHRHPESIIISEAACSLAIKNYLNALLEKTNNKILKLNTKINISI